MTKDRPQGVDQRPATTAGRRSPACEGGYDDAENIAECGKRT